MNEKLAEVKVGITSLLVAVSLILVGVFSLVATSIILLNQFIPLLKASGIVSGALMVGGFLFLKIAQRRLVSTKTETKGDEYTENLN